MKKIVKVLIVDDHAVVRTGVKVLLKSMNPAADVKSAENFSDALQLLKQEEFDLVILDINIPGGNNISMMDTIRLHRPKVPILIFTSYSEKIYGLPYLQAGANGFISKDASEKDLLLALNYIEEGKKYIGATLQANMLDSLINNGTLDANPWSKLSKREIDVANLLVKGYSTAQIAGNLNLQLSTVSTFKSRIFNKMKVSNVVELIARMKVAV
jgi:two-component system invasion response regulator UvrY